MTDPTRISDDQHNNAPAVPQGWRISKTRLDGREATIVNGPGGGCVACKDADIPRVVPESILYDLATTLLTATPAPAPAVPQGLDDHQVIRFASMILLQGNQPDSIEIRLQQFREHEKLRGSINPVLTPAVPDCEPIAWTVAGEVTNWSRDFSMYRTQHYVRPVYATTPATAPAQEVGLTDDEIKQACTDIYLSDHPQGSESYDIALGRAIIDALRAKGGK